MVNKKKSKKGIKIKCEGTKKKENNGAGRPTLLTEEKIKEICRYIENGNNYVNACRLSMIAEPTFYDWKKRGLEDIEKGKNTLFSQLIEEIRHAKATYKAWLIQNMNNSAQIDGKLALEILSRKYPDEFGKKEQIKMNIKSKITEHKIMERLELIRKCNYEELGLDGIVPLEKVSNE